jgi:hypothetical protein
MLEGGCVLRVSRSCLLHCLIVWWWFVLAGFACVHNCWWRGCCLGEYEAWFATGGVWVDFLVSCLLHVGLAVGMPQEDVCTCAQLLMAGLSCLKVAAFFG